MAGGVFPSRGGFSPVGGGSPWQEGGFCLAGGVLPGRGGGGGSPWQGGFSLLETPPVNRMTNRCKNITLATTSLRPVKSENSVADVFHFILPSHWNIVDGDVRMRLLTILLGPAHAAIPGSL